MKKIDLSEIIDALEMSSIDFTTFLNTNTYETIYISEMEKANYSFYDEEEEKPEWVKETVELFDDIFYGDDWIAIETYPYISDYNLLEDFCYGIEDDEISETLLVAINGRGAFRRFKYFAEKLGIINDWYDYKHKEYRKLAIQWCEENDIIFFEKK